MNQDQHRIDYMDRIDLRLLDAESEMAWSALARLLHDERYDAYGVIEMEVSGAKLQTLVGPAPIPKPVRLAYEHYLTAKLRWLRLHRWLESNGPVKRTTSEHVREQRDRAFDMERLRLLIEQTRSTDFMTAGTAWSEMVHG